MRWVVFVSLFMRSRCPEFCCYNIGLLGWVSKEWDTFAELTDNKTIEPFIVGLYKNNLYLLGNHLSSIPKHMKTSRPFVSHFFRLCCELRKYSRCRPHGDHSPRAFLPTFHKRFVNICPGVSRSNLPTVYRWQRRAAISLSSSART